MVPKIVFYIALLGVLLFGQTIHAQKSPEELLDEINRLPASERQKRLEEGARKKVSSSGTPYFAKKPWSLAIQMRDVRATMEA